MISPIPKVKFSLVNGIKIAYTEIGEKHPETLVFIHGLGENMQTWLKNIDGLKDRFHCVAIDLPGHGQSQTGDYPYTPYFFAETIAEFLLQQGLNQVNLVGHSLGGQIAILLSISKPTLVNKLILIAPAGFEVFSDSDKRWLINQSQSYINPMQGFDIMSLMSMHKSSFPTNDVYQAAVKGMLEQPVFEHLKLITQPTLVIFGEEDPFIPNRYLYPHLTPKSIAEAGVKQILGSKLVMIHAGGHFVHLERTDEVNREVERFAIR